MTHPDIITTSIWDEPGNVETLKAMWSSGMSASKIATALGEGVTRNMVIGKKMRLKLHRAETRLEDTRRVFGGAWHSLPGTTPVALVDLDHGMCKWPIGEGRPYLFCGAAAAGPYCPHHTDMSVGRGTESERSAIRVARKI